MGFHNKVLCTHKKYINHEMKCHCKIFQQKHDLKGYEKDDITKNQLLFIGVSHKNHIKCYF